MNDTSSHYSTVEDHYGDEPEEHRLFEGRGRLERMRVQRLLDRYLPDSPAVVRDVGGGPGFYANWLAEKGHEVHLVDLLDKHVQMARENSEAQPDHSLASAEQADARSLPWEDDSSDVVLLFGPMYHLQEPDQRRQALDEARRVLRPGGLLMATAISRYASTVDGLVQGLQTDEAFRNIARRDLETGRHDPPEDEVKYFTESYFHKPDELRREGEEAGFEVESVLSIEGPAALMQDFDERWEDEFWREEFLAIAEQVEDEKPLQGASLHYMLVARR